MTDYDKAWEAADFVRARTKTAPKLGMILGSGLGGLADEMEDAQGFAYGDIPHFPVPTVAGHAGRLVVGTMAGQPAMAMQGRFHFYEGYAMADVVRPVRVMQLLGVERLIVTNAAGGVNTDFDVGDLMLIADHVNGMGVNPLLGPNDDRFGPRFPDMSTAYDPGLRDLARGVAKRQGIALREGVYLGLTGPTYETPAEVRLVRTMGADAVGMSTVPEVIVAQHGGQAVLGISCITNMAAGILPQPLSHDEVMETTARVRDTFARLIKGIVAQMAAADGATPAKEEL